MYNILCKNISLYKSHSLSLIQRCGNFIERKKEDLSKGNIQFKSLRPLNKTTGKEGPYINSVQFHSKSTVAMVAGSASVVSIFQVSIHTSQQVWVKSLIIVIVVIYIYPLFFLVISFVNLTKSLVIKNLYCIQDIWQCTTDYLIKYIAFKKWTNWKITVAYFCWMGDFVF